MKIIESGIQKLRDPFILVENDAIYAYGTGWTVHRNRTKKLASGWEKPVQAVCLPEENDVAGDRWAPEVHKYNGAYYMFTTYRSAKSEHRGSVIFRADNPMGSFVPHSDGLITPPEWDCIDATLHIDDDGKPWMVFVHEWTCTDDGIGRFAAARLSDDLTRLITEPIELFRADSPDWTSREVTDGCFMYKTADGELLMIWSNFAPDGYAVGIARSENGKIDGKWLQENLLFSKTLSGVWEGGHGMIFELDGVKYLSIHAPNRKIGEREEMPIFIPLAEENGTIICK